MGHTKQAIRNKVQHATNTMDQAQPNPTPQGPCPMVLQNPLPIQGLVATAPPPQANPNTPGAPPIAETGVHHLLAMTTEEVNLQTRQNYYDTTTKPTDTSGIYIQVGQRTSSITPFPLPLDTPSGQQCHN